MITRLLLAISRLALRRPGAVVAAACIPALISLYALQVPLDFSFAGVMDRTHPEVTRYFEASHRHGLGGMLPLLIEGPEAVLDEAVLDLRLALDDLEEIRTVSTGPPRDWMRANAPWFVDRATFDHWITLAEAPPDPAATRDLTARLEALAQRHIPEAPDGSRLLLIAMTHDAFELALDASDFPAIREATREALAPHGARGHFAGMAAIITQEQEATIERMRWLGPISLVLVLLLLRGVERRVSMLVSFAIPMLLAVGCTMGIVGFVAGRLTIMESVFGVIVFGMGIDFGIHLMLRLREERAEGHSFEDSLERSIAGTGRGIVASAATTGGAFLLLAFAPDPVFYRLGLAGGLGLLLCLLFLMVLLPAEWSLIHRRSMAGRGEDVEDAGAATSFSVPGLASLAEAAARAPIATLAVTAVLLAVAAAQVSNLHYETNLERVFSRDIAAVGTAQRIHEQFGMDPGPWLVAVEEMDEARAVTEQFEAHPLFERAESVTFLFPADVEQRVARLAALAPGLAERVREEERAAARRGAANAPGDAGSEQRQERIDLLEALLRADALGPPELDALPASLSERLIGANGELLVYAFVKEPALDSAVAARERLAAQSIHPEATSMSAIYEALVGTDRPWMPQIVAMVLLFIALVIYADLRSGRLALLALVPVATASVVTLGVLNAFGFSFNTVTLVGVPLLLGLGVDDGIHIVHRMLEEPERPIARVVDSVGRSIAMTTATTCASVVALVFTRHPGIESVAILMLVGLPLSLLATVTVLPACAVLAGAQDVARGRARRAA